MCYQLDIYGSTLKGSIKQATYDVNKKKNKLFENN